jgi:hypothetical protein
MSLEFDTNGKIRTELCEKRDDFNFFILNFMYPCGNIPFSLPYAVLYITQLIRYARACSTNDQFLIRGCLLTNKLMSGDFNSLAYRQLSAIFMVVTTILSTHTTFRWPHAV